MTYPIRQPPDNDPAYQWTQPIRDTIGGVNDHQTRVTSLESNALLRTLADAKGDLPVASAADTFMRLAVGTVLGQVLTVDPSTGSGMFWGSGGALLAINTQTASYTATLTDLGKVVLLNTASAASFTIPPNSSVAFPVSGQLGWRQRGIGQITVVAGAGVTLNTPSSLTTRARYSEMWAHQVAINEWDISGDMS